MQLNHGNRRDLPRAIAITAIITGGLAFDQLVEFWGQTLTNIGIWAVLLYWLRRAAAGDRLALGICVMYATLGEIFLSLVWGLYEYRLANVPLFVPPGHALLFMLGRILAERARAWIEWFVPLAAAPFVLLLAWSRLGTLDALLFVMFLLCLMSGRASRLYSVMFVLSLAMEIYGTWLGNWTWAEEAPWLGFTTINPPLAAGAFYCMLDMLVVATVAAIRAAPRTADSVAPVPAPQFGVRKDQIRRGFLVSSLPPALIARTKAFNFFTAYPECTGRPLNRKSRSAATTGIAAVASRSY